MPKKYPTHDEAANCTPSNLQVVEGAQQVDFVIGQHNARLRHILDGHLHSPVLARNPADCTAQVVASERFDWKRS
jgi:hypothetical protein